MAVKLAGLTPKDAREKRAALIQNARSLHEEHGDDWGEDHEKQYNEMLDDASKLLSHAERTSQLEAMAGESDSGGTAVLVDPQDVPGQKRADLRKTILIRNGSDASGRPRYEEVPANGPCASEKYCTDFGHYLQTGHKRAGLYSRPDDQSGAGSPAMAIQSDNAEQAGYLLASEQFAAGMLKEVDDLLFIRRWAKIHTLREAASTGIRARTARASTFGWTSELEVSTADSSLKYGKRVLTPHHATGTIEVSRDLLRRSMGTAESEVRGELARDAGELMEDGYLTGDGAQKPLGLYTASANGISTGRDVQTGSATSITADGLINAKYSLKSQYRTGSRGPLRWNFHRDAIKIIAKLKDSENQYLFRIGMGVAQDTGQPEDDLLGYPVDESERTPNTFTTGLYVGGLFNYRYYEIADALDMEIQVLFELKALTNQVQYVARLKTDGMPTLEEAFVRLITN